VRQLQLRHTGAEPPLSGVRKYGADQSERTTGTRDWCKEEVKEMSIDEEKLLRAFREWHLSTYFSPPSSALVIHEARWEGFRAGAKFVSGFDAQEVTVTRSVRQSRKRSSKPTLK
jgi:hypothetical protein